MSKIIGLCKTPYCRNKNRFKKHEYYCAKCLKRRLKERDPVRYFYHTLKNRAKRRGKVFTLTLEQYKSFVTETNYLLLKGSSKNSLTIDRIDNNRGYEFDNIRAITCSENSRKGNKEVVPF